jgi:hypothetical protein
LTVIVTGSRLCGWQDWPGIKAALEAAHPTLVVQGGARGADELARRWAAANDVPCETFAAHWELGRAAGPLRNARMLDAHRAALVLAFPKGDSPGTWGTVKLAQERGMTLLVLQVEERVALPEFTTSL